MWVWMGANIGGYVFNDKGATNTETTKMLTLLMKKIDT